MVTVWLMVPPLPSGPLRPKEIGRAAVCTVAMVTSAGPESGGRGEEQEGAGLELGAGLRREGRWRGREAG